MRDIDCQKYNECLNIAAKSNSKLDCAKCKSHDTAVELGRKGGLKGGPARATILSPKRRTEIARKAATQRWMREFDKQTKLFNCPFCYGNNLTFETNMIEVGDFTVFATIKTVRYLAQLEKIKMKQLENGMEKGNEKNLVYSIRSSWWLG